MKFGLLIVMLGAAMIRGAEPVPSLADAVQSNDQQTIRVLLQKKADVRAAQPDGTTALHWASFNDDWKTAQLLLAAGADVKAVNRYGVTPLSLACSNGSAVMIEGLLKAGADANGALPGGETPLMTAARTGKLDAVQVLLKAGAEVNAKESKRGQTALMWAAAEGNTEVVEALLKAGADMHAKLDSGFTPFLFAVREGRIPTVKAFLKAGADVNETITPARNAGRRPGVPRPGSSALHLAVGNAHYELGAFLLDAGADPNAILPGYTPLHMIMSVRKPGGGDNDPAPEGSGNLSSLDMVRKLVAKGANINSRMTKKVNFGLTSLNTSGATPYFLAARTADAQLMRELAKLGADTSIPNDDKSTPLMAAAGLGTRSPGEDAGTEPEVIEAMAAAVELGANVDAVNDNGETAMHGAAYKNLPGAVQWLSDHGAKIEVWNKKNKYGWTPLRIAEGYRFGNFKPSFDTMAVFRKIMTAAGVSIVTEGGGSEDWKN